MSGRSIDELADTIRRRLDRDADQIRTAWQERLSLADELATMQGTTVLMSGWRAHREVAGKRAMLDRLLAEPHAVDESGWCDCDQIIDGPCTCGRDERVRGYLELMAGAPETGTAG